MDITALPFNLLIGLETAEPESEFLVKLPEDRKYTNHLGTVHGSALMAVAEAGSGAYLAKQLGGRSGFIPVVRRLEAKFRKPASGQVAARCMVKPEEIARWAVELDTRGRLSASIPVEVVDGGGIVALTATVEWFITRAP